MTKRILYVVWVLSLCAFTALFSVRQRSLHDLRSGNESLRPHTEGPAGSEPAGASTETAAALSEEEKRELLRLRGQIASLRSEAAEASNQVARLAQPGAARSRSASPKGDTTIQQLTLDAFYQDADRLAKQVHAYMLQHDGQIPEALSMVATSNDQSSGVLDRFELVRSGAVNEDSEVTPFILIAHEREPVQLPDGKWMRLYIQANGGVTIAGPLPNKPPLDDSEFLRHMEEQGRDRSRRKQIGASP